MKTKKFTTTQLTMLGLMAAVLLLMAYTPLGYLNIGPLAISFNVIPVAISAVVLGPTGGAIAGAIFGLTSFGQCIGLGGTSAMGAMLFSINPVLAFIQRFVPRLLDGICLGYIYKAMRKKTNVYVSCAVDRRLQRSNSSRRLIPRSVWKYRVCTGTDGWKKYHHRMLYDGWNQCSM